MVTWNLAALNHSSVKCRHARFHRSGIIVIRILNEEYSKNLTIHLAKKKDQFKSLMAFDLTRSRPDSISPFWNQYIKLILAAILKYSRSPAVNPITGIELHFLLLNFWKVTPCRPFVAS
jgi:hypothetical protein